MNIFNDLFTNVLFFVFISLIFLGERLELEVEIVIYVFFVIYFIGRKMVIVLVGMIDWSIKGEIGLLLYSGEQEKYR